MSKAADLAKFIGNGTRSTVSAFAAKPSAQISNVAADNSQTTIVFGNELFDQNGDYDASTGIFTAPVAGNYQFNCTLRLDTIDSAPAYYSVFFRTSSTFVPFLWDPDMQSGGGDLVYFPVGMSTLLNLPAAETVEVRIQQASGTAQTDIVTDSFFSGFLVC
tara:strand:+ start:498 stop:980 length:483 start_codon:yes stop_codon:yes gene_type:complete